MHIPVAQGLFARAIIESGYLAADALATPAAATRAATDLVAKDETAAALAGVAPYDRDSGKFRGVRHISGG